MRHVRAFLARLLAPLRSRRMDRDLDDEIASHLAEAIEEYIQQGLSPEDARRAAVRRFGGVTQTKEIYREVRSFMWLDNLRRDLRYALRSLRRSPGFTTVAVFTLALGIGASAAIFSVVNAVLLEPLPYADPARLVAVKETRPLAGGTTGLRVNVPVSAGSFFDWRKQAPALEQVAAVVAFDRTYAGGTEPEQIGGASVSANFFPMLGVAPMLGRNFQPEEERPNAGNVVLLSHGFWQRRFAGDPSVIGQALTLDGGRVTIIGVMPPWFDGAGSAGLTRNAACEVWTPLTLVEAQRTREFGIRMALGAKLHDMLKLIVGHGMKLVLAGLVLGVAGSLALTKVLGGMLFNVRATDPVTFVAVCTLLAAVGALACYLPARRAAKVDPIVALRAE